MTKLALPFCLRLMNTGVPGDRSSPLGWMTGVPGDRSSSLGWMTGVPGDRSSSLGWMTGESKPHQVRLRKGVLTRSCVIAS